jgi:hypothetical protein
MFDNDDDNRFMFTYGMKNRTRENTASVIVRFSNIQQTSLDNNIDRFRLTIARRTRLISIYIDIVRYFVQIRADYSIDNGYRLTYTHSSIDN